MKLSLEPCSAERRRAFESETGRVTTAPEDDMWASFAEQAAAFLLLCEGERIGCLAIDEVRVLHRFSLLPRFEDRGEEALRALIAQEKLIAAVPSTVDPAFLALSLSLGGEARPVALMFQQVLEPAVTERAELRVAEARDHAASLALAQTAIGGFESFLGPYFQERIDRGELRLLEDEGGIIGSGELRIDPVHEGYAHLGFMVRKERRSRGIGRRILAALIAECERRELRPICSTDPENTAARRAIHAVGFRSKHRVFQVPFGAE